MRYDNCKEIRLKYSFQFIHLQYSNNRKSNSEILHFLQHLRTLPAAHSPPFISLLQSHLFHSSLRLGYLCPPLSTSSSAPAFPVLLFMPLTLTSSSTFATHFLSEKLLRLSSPILNPFGIERFYLSINLSQKLKHFVLNPRSLLEVFITSIFTSLLFLGFSTFNSKPYKDNALQNPDLRHRPNLCISVSTRNLKSLAHLHSFTYYRG